MTPKFDEIIEQILESHSFADLPSNAPYGFWIAPSGEYFVVAEQRHEDVAQDIIDSNPQLKKEYIDNRSHISKRDFLKRKRYLRISVIFSKDYALETYYYENNNPIPFDPTPISIKTAKDIAKFYDIRLTFYKK